MLRRSHIRRGRHVWWLRIPYWVLLLLLLILLLLLWWLILTLWGIGRLCTIVLAILRRWLAVVGSRLAMMNRRCIYRRRWLMDLDWRWHSCWRWWWRRHLHIRDSRSLWLTLCCCCISKDSTRVRFIACKHSFRHASMFLTSLSILLVCIAYIDWFPTEKLAVHSID